MGMVDVFEKVLAGKKIMGLLGVCCILMTHDSCRFDFPQRLEIEAACLLQTEG